MISKLNHVAIAVPDLEAAIVLYRDVLGADISEIVDLPAHGAHGKPVLFLHPKDFCDTLLEPEQV